MKALNCPLLLLLFFFVLLENVLGYSMIITMPIKPNKARQRNIAQRKCTTYLKECLPNRDNCCGNLICTNILQGYCLYPFEPCYCMHTSFYNTDLRR